MILRGLKLENIRSYTTQSLEFPLGSVLLSGDIGSGKSTILLALDFALFGIQKNLSGGSLLRHGAEEGSVELTFEVGDDEYTIKRVLKRKKDTVRQDAGYIVSGGMKKDLTAQESKSFILSLLGYPAEALKKDSALIYRYTVYTPQEEMKQIIEANSDERLDLIRRLFGMDKYKRISENAELYAKELRGRVRELSGSIADLDLKLKERESILVEIKTEEKGVKELSEKFVIELKKSEDKKKEVLELQAKIETVNKKKQEYASLKAEFDAKKEEQARIKKSYEEIDPKLKEVEEKLKIKIKKPLLTVDDINRKLSDLESKESASVSRKATLATEVRSLKEIFDKGVCGTCHQDVADREQFSAGIKSKENEISKIEKEMLLIQPEKDKLWKTLEEVQSYDSHMRVLNEQVQRKDGLIELKQSYTTRFKGGQETLKKLADTINVIAKEIKGDEFSQLYKTKQTEYETLRNIAEQVRREESILKEKLTGYQRQVTSLDEEIKKKEESKKKMDEYTQYDRWLRDFFVNLMGTIEKHVMVNVQHEFNALFQKWFSMLVADEGLSARVDNRFSVVVEQNGYQTEYGFMSGGERTAVALAYRLALNRVINDLVERIRTKDLMILDEPTDGFSSDQMDSVREILSELGNKQTIIVSHESKIESFVDEVLRVSKVEGVSSLSS